VVCERRKIDGEVTRLKKVLSVFDIALVFDGLRERRQVRWRFGDEVSDVFEES
jgi:hypothetical protein